MNYIKLVNADRLKDCLLLEGNLGHIKTLKDVERVIDFQVDRQPTTVFEFVDNCESSAWVCDCCGGGIKGQESPESLGNNCCPFCGLLIEVGK